MQEEFARVPTEFGDMQVAYFEVQRVIVARVGDLDGRSSEDGPLVRLHSECATGDLFGSTRCDCGAQLRRSLQRIHAERWGVLLYIRNHEGRGIGLRGKIAAYNVQDLFGLDTYEANLVLGHQADERCYDAACEVLVKLGVRRMRLLTNNPAKLFAVRRSGIDARIEPLQPMWTRDNYRYLESKRTVGCHQFDCRRPS